VNYHAHNSAAEDFGHSREVAVPIYISQGRYTRDAIKGMIAKPEDRSEAVGQLLQKAGGKLLSYYLTFGEYDFLLICEAPSEQVMASVVLVAAAGGGVSDVRTTLALTSKDAKTVFGSSGELAGSFRSAGMK
jgi:uncharacterized protein with GYD domain